MSKLNLIISGNTGKPNAPTFAKHVHEAKVSVRANTKYERGINPIGEAIHTFDISSHYTDGKEREQELINITFADGNIWSGTFDKLRKALIDGADEDQISIKWCTDDVIDRGQEQGVELTEAQARSILAICKRNHDCNIGITWETIDVWTNEYLQDARRLTDEV